jgi:hypothetical protein
MGVRSGPPIISKAPADHLQQLRLLVVTPPSL